MNAATLAATGAAATNAAAPWRQWMCGPCGWIYDERLGLPEAGIAPGTRFDDLPADWVCPDCGDGKDAFVEVPA